MEQIIVMEQKEGSFFMEQKKDFFTILNEYKQALRADESFDVVTRVFMVSDKHAVLFFVDGMIKDETMTHAVPIPAFRGHIDSHAPFGISM